MDNWILPSKQGQICKVIELNQGENPLETYIITEDVCTFSNDKIIYIVSVTDLLRNIPNPKLAPLKAIKKINLSVVAEDITSYVESWNNQ